MVYFLSWGAVWLLIAVTLSAFIHSPALRVAAILAISLVLKFRPGFDPENAVFAVSALIGAVSIQRLPFDRRLSLLLGNVISLAIFFAFTYFIR